MDQFTPLASTVGGLLIGLSATALLLFNGRVAGMSGIFAGVLRPKEGDLVWRAAFVVGVLAAGLGLFLVAPHLFAVHLDRAPWMVGVAGLLVGVGVRLGGGCTSGHGVCGLSRMSPRSLVATLTFIATGAITVLLARVLGGAA